MKEKYIIISSQEYQYANHKDLWGELANRSNEDVIVIDIPADLIVSVLKRKKYRLDEARLGVRKIDKNLFVIRPMIYIRPEFLSDRLLPFQAKRIWKSLKKYFPDIYSCRCNILVYDARWVRILKNSHPNIKIGYYLYDEVRNNGFDNSINKERYRHDEFACKNSDVVFTMTKCLAISRSQYNSNIVVLGNGAKQDCIGLLKYPRIPNSVAFVGNFRDWIDKDLLETLIKNSQDKLFCFVGSIEENMKSFFYYLLNTYPNMTYFGRVTKENINMMYKVFGCVIIPYLNNSFIKATRPIKIVESVLAGIPVVTIPMDGYEENKFIRFASTYDEFSREIDFVLSNPIDLASGEYKAFCEENTWTNKANIIIKEFCKL